MDFTSQHIGRFKSTKRIDVRSTEPGMIVSGTYTDRNGISEKGVWLVLNPRYKGLMHAIALSAIAPQRLIALALQTKVIQAPSTGYSKLVLSLTGNSTGGQMQFYNSTLKAQLKSNLAGSYRTLEPSRLKSTLIVDYKWPKNIAPGQKDES